LAFTTSEALAVATTYRLASYWLVVAAGGSLHSGARQGVSDPPARS
jgi:hypothetical protein